MYYGTQCRKQLIWIVSGRIVDNKSLPTIWLIEKKTVPAAPLPRPDAEPAAGRHGRLRHLQQRRRRRRGHQPLQPPRCVHATELLQRHCKSDSCSNHIAIFSYKKFALRIQV